MNVRRQVYYFSHYGVKNVLLHTYTIHLFNVRSFYLKILPRDHNLMLLIKNIWLIEVFPSLVF